MPASRTVSVVAAALLSLTGCGGSVRTGQSVAFLAANVRLAYVQELTMGFGWGVERIGGIKHTESGAAVGDTTRQLTMIEDLRDQDHGGVSVFTLTPELLAGSLAAAANSGTPVIAVHSPPALGSVVTLYVGNDNYELGTMLGEQIAARLPAGTTGVAVLGTSVPGSAALDQRVVGLRAVLAAKVPGLRLLGPFDTKEDPAANREAWQVLTRANPKARAFLGVGDDDAATLATVREQAHGTWLAAGFGVDDRALRAVQAGDLLLVSPESFLQGAVAGWLQAGHAKTGRALPQGWIVVPGLAVTAANVAQIIARQKSVASRAAVGEAQVQDMVTSIATYLRPLTAAR